SGGRATAEGPPAAAGGCRPLSREGARRDARGSLMAKLSGDGVKIDYGSHGSGPTILLSHGYSSTCRMWDGQVAALKDRYQVLVWDMRGHGESDYPKDPALYSEGLTIGDMRALLDVVGADKAIVAGLSLGGYMSLAFHASHPNRVRALMLFDTGPGFKKDEA